MNKLSGTFYPFATRNQVNAIKIASIYFDDVYLLTPISLVKKKELNGQYQDLSDKFSKLEKLLLNSKTRIGTVFDESLHDEAVRTTLDFQKQAKPLIDAGVIKVVNPFDEMRNVGLEQEFQVIIEYRAKQAKERANERRRSRPMVIAVSAECCDARENWSTGLLYAEERALKNIMYDSAVLVSKKFNSIPVTGDDNFVREFQNQIEKTERNITPELTRFAVERERDSYDIMTQSIIDNVPSFDSIPFKDILNLRRHCEDELEAFRNEARKLATTISYKSSDKEKSKAILDIVAKEVTPIVSEIERKVKLSRKKWAKNLIDKSTSAETLVSLFSTVFVGVPLQYGLLIAAGVAGIQASMESYFETKETQALNGLSFLVQLRKKK